MRLPELQGDGGDGDARVGDGASVGFECRRTRWRSLHRLGVRHGTGPYCDAALRHPGHTDSLRFGREIPVPDLAMKLPQDETCSRSETMRLRLKKTYRPALTP